MKPFSPRRRVDLTLLSTMEKFCRHLWALRMCRWRRVIESSQRQHFWHKKLFAQTKRLTIRFHTVDYQMLRYVQQIFKCGDLGSRADAALLLRASLPVRMAPDPTYRTGLLRKRMEGKRKVKEAAERQSEGEKREGGGGTPDPSSMYKAVTLWEIADVRSLVGGMYSEPASGLEWQNVGEAEPSEERQLNEEHRELRTALGREIMFAQKEWDDFGITDLLRAHFVSGAHHFKPAL